MTLEIGVPEFRAPAAGTTACVTEIRRRRDRVTISFDSAAPLECNRSFEVARHFTVGDVVEPIILDRLRQRAAVEIAEAIAEKLLAQRPRSELELLTRLKRRDVRPPIAKEAVASLRERGLIDDAAFARYWTEERVRARPRAARQIQAELRGMGVAASVAAAATTDVPDDELALQLARKAARRFRGNWTVYERRVGGMLLRRGFTHGVAQRALRDAWEPQEEAGAFEAP